ncbi:right-handed parallel beta-helix repeat-containing protein [Paenibacillus sp. V4I7]|uniref:right-handed parallel beta-helix repeat-containing protein n=1 Tax=Paenibacillus sp. V4I7 TaxID=3042307 RepID=UPI0027D8DD52|nr:right-handed parallel beta-helix repeat-containing protein [Paenibacillus sp. V4I7]
MTNLVSSIWIRRLVIYITGQKDGSISQQTIIAPKVKSLISLQGASESSRIHHVQLDGLSFQDTDFTDWYRHAWPNNGDSGEGHTFPQYDRQMTMPQHRTGMLLLQNTDHIAITNSHFRNSGYSAVYMLFYNQNNTVSGNLIEHAGHSGVILEGKYPGEGDVSKNNLITNNVIHDVGELVGNGSGVYLMNSGSNEVSYSEIYNSPRYAVAFDTYVGIATTNIYLKNNVMKYLKISNTSQDSGDTASIYSWGRSAAANTVDQVTIDHVYADPSMQDYVPNGLFMDNESSGQVFSNMKITNTQGVPYRTNSSSGHTLTNVSWQAGFNDSLMDYANIGIKASFPYAVTPLGLTTSFTGSQVNLSWLNVNNASSYDVLRSTVQGGPYTTTVCSAVTTTTCGDATGTPGTTYYYVVKSRTSAGLTSGNSNEATQLYKELVFDGFENGLTSWTAVKGTASTSTAQAHSGSNSYVINQDTDVITHSFSTNINKIVTLWFYDDASDTSMQTMAKVDNTIWSDATVFRGLGVNTPTSTTKYVTRINGPITATSVTRTTGWHELKWDYTSGTKVDMYIDGILVASPTGVTNFNQISMGDWWTSNTGTVYFDDISITNPFNDGFESGLSNWTAAKGTSSTSTAQAHSGSNSYIIDQDTDAITHSFSSSENSVVTLWFYDDAADTSLQTMAKVDNTIWSDSQWRGLGVNTPTSTTKYATRIGSSYAATSISRTTGWHEFKWDYTSGTKVDMYIDGVLVASPTGMTEFNQISIGDWWSGNTGTVYFDDVNVIPYSIIDEKSYFN